MAKISISQVLHLRSRVRIFTVMATLVVGAFLFQMMIAQNPGSAEATSSCSDSDCTIDETGTLQRLGYTQRFFGSTTVFDIPVYADLTITGSATEVTFSGSLNFANFTIENNATVTHEFATATDDVNSLKKVDITTTGDIILQTGGKINVSGMGYPGGTQAHTKGYGLGGGSFNTGHDGASGVGSGGGGYGGAGGYGLDDGGVPALAPGGVTYPAENNPIDFGSGSGLADNTGGSTSRAPGVPGGGRVLLSVANFLIKNCNGLGCGIFANGENGTTSAGSGDAYSGGGSGGSIKLSFSNNAYPLVATATNGGKRSADGTVYYSGFGNTGNLQNVYFTANGGSTNHDRAGGGGGGRIYIEKINNNNISIKKTLSPVRRPSLGTDPDEYNKFNPYALQVNDVIRVNLDLSNLILNQSFTLTDTPLSNGQGISCEITGSIDYGACSATESDLVAGIDVMPGSTSSCIIRYECKVQ